MALSLASFYSKARGKDWRIVLPVMIQMLKSHFMHQKMMTKVLLSLIPIYLMSIYLFGWRVLVLLAVVTVAGSASEILVMRLVQKDKVKLTEACFVSCALFTLTLPPATPYWVAVVGIVFGIVFAKATFGGFGQNIFNPALVGRCFIYIAFPSFMTMGWLNPYSGFPGGFARFIGGPDLISEATPIAQLSSGGTPALEDLIFGFTGGSLGETSAVLILLAGIYLAVTKTASWKIMVSTLGSAGILSAVLYLTGVTAVQPHYALLSGGLFFAAIFMATDPVSAPRDETSKWIFGVLIGTLTVVIRHFGTFVEGVMFATLIANAFAPLLDRNIREGRKALKERRQVEPAASAGKGGNS